MNDLLDEFEGLAKDMEDALVNMDSNRVAELAPLQQNCLNKIQAEVTDHPENLQLMKERLTQIQALLDRNQLLLENAMAMTDNYIRTNLSFDAQG